MAGRYYVDTSAYLAILLHEAAAPALEQELRGGELCSSTLLVLESTRNLVRLAREGSLSTQDLQACLARLGEDMEQFALRDLTLDLCTGLVLPVVSTPRSLDLAHLRTAVWFHQRQALTRFVSLASDQSEAARELGLPT